MWLYAYDFSCFCRPISIKDSKVYPDTTSDDVLLGLFHTFYKLLQSSNTFIDLVKHRSNRTIRIQIGKCSLWPKHPSVLQIIKFELIRRHMIWLYYFYKYQKCYNEIQSKNATWFFKFGISRVLEFLERKVFWRMRSRMSSSRASLNVSLPYFDQLKRPLQTFSIAMPWRMINTNTYLIIIVKKLITLH